MADDTHATSEEVRSAVEALKAALDSHLAAVVARAGENDPQVQAAYDSLAAAGEAYDDALFSAYEEVTPFGPVEGIDDDGDDEDDDTDDTDDVDDLEWESDDK
ncbi:MAG: hypothetical protein ACRDU4_10640 [Mycobacterium sp.]